MSGKFKRRSRKLSKAATQARSKNITEFNEGVAAGRALPGSLKHGAHSKHIRKRYTDKRTREGKQLALVLRNLTEDIGPDLSAGQCLLLDRVREKLIVLMQIGKFVDDQSSIINGKGELLPCLGRNYTSFSEALRRDIESLYSQANKRPKKVPTIQELIAEHDAKKASEQ